MSPAQPSISPALLKTILDSPAGAPPPGQVSDLNAANPFHDLVWILCPLFLSITGILVAVRLYTQHFLSKRLALEDYMIVIAYAFQFAAIVTGVLHRNIIGNHIWNITIADAMELLKAINTVSILYAVGIGTTKVAILLQYIRLFASRHVNKPLRIACWVWITINSLYYTVDMLVSILQCLPREKIWNLLYVGPGHCLDVYDIWFGTGVFNTISDVAILVLPIPAIAKLQMPTRKRVFVIAIFATGSLACVASAIRTYYTWRTLRKEASDQTYWMEYVGMWIWIEMFIGICVFCAPTIPQFCLHVRARTRHFYGVLSARTTSSSSPVGSSTLKNTSASSYPTSEDTKGGSGLRSPPLVRLPFADVSLASFELASPAEGVEQGRDIRVTRSVLQVVESADEEKHIYR